MEMIYVKVTLLRTLDSVPEIGREQFGKDAQITGYFNEPHFEWYSVPIVPLMGKKRSFECFKEKIIHMYQNTIWDPHVNELSRSEWQADVAHLDREIEELMESW